MKTNSSRFTRFGMTACCAIMLLPVAAFFIAGGTASGLAENLAVFAPLLFCLGVHLLLHRFIGGLCRGHTSKQENDAATTTLQLQQDSSTHLRARSAHRA